MIVIFAREDDRHATTVAGILARDHAEEVTIFDLSLFPGSVRLSGSFSAQDGGYRFVDRDNRRIDFGSVKSFWWRRPQSLHPDPRIADTNVQSFALHECLSGLYGMLRCCPGLWVNDIEHDQNADYKPRQLAVVRRHGLPVAEGMAKPESVVCVLTGHGLKDPDTALGKAPAVTGCVAELAAVETAVFE